MFTSFFISKDMEAEMKPKKSQVVKITRATLYLPLSPIDTNSVDYRLSCGAKET